MDISCRNTKQSAGNIITQSNFLTLKYVTDGWGTDSNGFKLIITAIKNISMFQFFRYFHISFYRFHSFSPRSDHACKEFRCKSSEFCVSSDLVCDGINHCGDGTDESPHSLCPSKFYVHCVALWEILLPKLAFQTLKPKRFWAWNWRGSCCWR